MRKRMEDVLNRPRVVAWLMKRLVPECCRLSVEEIMDVYMPKTHRWGSWAQDGCWVYDLDIPINVNVEELSLSELSLYDKARSALLRFNGDFYAICNEDMRRGYRVVIEFSKNLEVSYVEETVLVPAYAYFLTIHVGRTGDMFSEIYRYISSSETLKKRYEIYI